MYQIPVYHPLVNHFPIALLVLAGGTVLIWLFTGQRFWRLSTLLLTGTGALGAFIAMRTGHAMEEFSAGRPMVKKLVEHHEELADITVYLSLAAFVFLLAVIYWARRADPQLADALIVRIVIATLVLASAALVSWTSHVGGTMTWGEEVQLFETSSSSVGQLVHDFETHNHIEWSESHG
jgi:uncharacterized membrane protein